MKVFRRHALQKGLGDWQQDSIAFTAQLGSERTGSLWAFVSKAGLDILTSHSSSVGHIVLYWQWCRRTFSLLESSPSTATTVWFSSQERTVPGLSPLNAPSGTFPGVTVTHCHQFCKAWLSKEITFEPSSTSMVKCSCFQNNYANNVYAYSRNIFWRLCFETYLQACTSCGLPSALYTPASEGLLDFLKDLYHSCQSKGRHTDDLAW